MTKTSKKYLNTAKHSLFFSKPKASSNDDDNESMHEKYLGFELQQHSRQCMVVNIDEPIVQPSYYRMVVNSIDKLGEGDELVYKISSVGGSLDGLEYMLSSTGRTEADTTAVIEGNCHSAASMLALSCNNVIVSPYATMLVHFMSYGTGGKASDVARYVTHIQSVAEELFKDIYEGFLSDDEIEQCIKGVEFWFSADEIVERLQNRQKFMKEQACEECTEECCSECQLLEDDEEVHE